MDYREYLDKAVEAARAAEEVIRYYYARETDVRLKADRSPVTRADVESEQAIKAVLSRAFPSHGFYGEELGRESADAEYVWLIDPIDGTKSFIRGYPFFSTQIALMHRGELVCGVSNAPLFNELACAAKGGGTWLNDIAIAVSEIDDLGEATLSFGNVATLAGSPRWRGLGELVRRVNRVRGYGDFYHYHLLASGRVDIVLESDVNILDIAALAVVLREAGGEITDLEGREIDLDTTSVFATNGRLKGEVKAILESG